MQDLFCKTCGSKLFIKESKKKTGRSQKTYYYTHYYFCPHCHKIYLNDQFKVSNNNLSLFTTPNLEGDVQIWTDGACTGNGTARAKAAWAFVAPGKGQDYYEEAGLVTGEKKTNNTAEALAIYHALLWAVGKKYKKIIIHTDSQITLYGLQKKAHLVKANQEIFRQIADLVTKNKLDVTYRKVAGHAGDINNERADKLANSLALS